MKLSRELDYRIRYDVEHDLFHALNVFSDEYITPTFVEYVQKLEKENAELKQAKEGKVVEHFEAYGQCRDSRRIAELEKENAELKDDNKVMADNYSKMEQKFYDNLTKAKEHIENLFYYVKQCTCERSNYAEIEKDIKEAEQFLSEVEK